MLMGSRHPSHVLSSARSIAPMLLFVLLQCLLLALLADAARPASHEDNRAALEVGKVQSLEIATMRPRGGFVRQRQTNNSQVQRKSLHRHNSSVLQLQRHQKLKVPVPDDEDLLVSGESDEHLNPIDALDLDRSNISEDELVSGGLGSVSSEPELDPVPSRIIQQVGEHGLGASGTDSANVNSGERSEPPRVEEPFKFKDAAGQVGAFEQSAAKMKEHVDGVAKAWEKVDGDMTKYDESIKDLSQQFKKMGDSAHGIHNDVVNELGDKEKKRMCSFKNADRVLAGQPEIDCNTI